MFLISNTERRYERMVRARRKADTRARHRNCTPVSCWVCGLREWRDDATAYTLPLVTDRASIVLVFGRCGNPLTYGDGPGCDGHMVRRADRRRVLQSALEYDRAGLNGSAEYA